MEVCAIRVVTWQKIERQWLAGYELLHSVAYRLIGKQNVDEDGIAADLPGAALTRRQRLFCLLFPLLATLGLMVTLAAVWLYTYIQLFPHITHPTPTMRPRSGTLPYKCF